MLLFINLFLDLFGLANKYLQTGFKNNIATFSISKMVGEIIVDCLVSGRDTVEG